MGIMRDIGRYTVRASLEKAREVAEEKIQEALRSNALELDLRGLGLIDLPSTLSQLRNLKKLDLSVNRLTTIPDVVCRLSDLDQLTVAHNELTELPEAIQQLARLRYFDVSDNRLTNLPEGVGRLTKLRQLNVGFNQLTTLPESVGQLTQLERLDVGRNKSEAWQLMLLDKFFVGVNQLTALPESVGQLTQLKELYVGGNQLAVLPETLGQLTQLERLDVGANQLTALPESVGQLTQLQLLDVGGNQLTVLPETLGQLTQLQQLDVRGNQLTVLPETLGQLTQLQQLDVGGNQLMALPESVGQLTQLEKISAEKNQLTRLPEGLSRLSSLIHLFLHDNPALGLPPEVLGPVTEDHGQPAAPSGIIAYYFNSRMAKPLNEAQLILVGRGGVGKTSLVQRLLANTFNPNEQKTDGIAITPWKIQVGQDEVRLNIWDFGGQEIMHATHQFFFTKRSVYILVLNAREGEQEANIEYWLRLIESFGGESPVIVVINKVKQYVFDLNRRGLQEKFHSVREFIQTDCEDGRGIPELLAALRRETDRLDHLRDRFPADWFVVKNKLATLQENFIDFEEYRKLCEENGISDDKSQETLVGFLHDLGLVINFRDDARLADTHVLSPHWVTNGIYKILNCEAFAQRKGELHFSELKNVLSDREYPRRMHQFLLDLMGKFELCYESYDGNGNYLIPELLGRDEPDLTGYMVGEALCFVYHYNILPEGLLPRLVVRSRSLNKDLPRWRTGAVLEFEGNRAIVKADVQGRKVAIAVYGEGAGRRRLLSVIRSEFEALHASITRLQVQERVPIPAHPNVWVDYNELLVLEDAGETELTKVAGGKVIKFSIPELLKGVEEQASRSDTARDRQGLSAKPITVVYSYSHKDAELRDQLETHLTLLKRTGVISTWHDRQISAGEEWKGKIDDQFKQADLILLLVSADFVSSDYCWDIEMKTALERHRKKEAKVVPVIIRECQWYNAPFARLEPLPKDGKAVKESPSIDRAWKTVADGIEEAALELRRRK